MLSYSWWVPINLIQINWKGKLIRTINRYWFPLILKTTLLSPRILALGKSNFNWFGLDHFPKHISLYHAFRACSVSGCFSQHAFNAFFEITLTDPDFQSYHFGNYIKIIYSWFWHSCTISSCDNFSSFWNNPPDFAQIWIICKRLPRYFHPWKEVFSLLNNSHRQLFRLIG